ncbi:hypothetical protein [Ponticaulis sp.]|uniref:hypothetical protein n=1 Tax=Ponticaulis sp. TaxID=2020902 RepID=UPI00260C98E5|nr:hypothetical protein [Ponticaulis sp.]MDF1679577.1 hypothetical protein [Ponticaulis sp.]
MTGMKMWRTGLAGGLALLLAACGGSVSEGVMETYSGYAAAVSSGRGYDATEYVSEATIDRFETMRQIALYGPESQPSLGIHDEIAVYYLRSEFDASHLQRLTGRDIMNILVSADLIGENGFRNIEAGEVVEAGDNRASLPLRDTRSGANYSLDFVRENGEWLADPRGFRNQRDQRLEGRIREFNGNRSEVINELLIVHGASDGLTAELSNPLLRQN